MYISEELEKRCHKTPDYLREKQALQELAAMMVDHPAEVLPRLVDLAMALTGAVSGGLSLFEESPAPGVFRWRYLRGALAPFNNATTPRNFSPCGVTLDVNRPVLCKHPEQFYDWISDANIVVPEVLLVPLYLGAKNALGTLWIIAEDEGHFDRNDERVVTELATFAGIALRMVQTEADLEKALEEQETLAKEMSHRVKNLFALADGLVRLTARAASGSVDEMVRLLTGRFHALSSAHRLVRRSFADVASHETVTNIGALLSAILKPYEHAAISRFHIEGPNVALGERSLNGIALVFHELATNAAKYGALKVDEGTVGVTWAAENGALVFHWVESGGPAIPEKPSTAGFGSKLLRETITRQFAGELSNEWKEEGLHSTLRLPLAALRQ
jgi:two-component sensor histidine kinase